LTGSAAKARLYALTLLRYRGRSEKELRDRLRKKGYQQVDIDATVVNLRDSGFLDDKALAENLKRQAMTNKLLGFDGARRLMQQRGLPRQIIDRAHAMGLKVYGGTLTPFQAFLPGVYYTSDGEAKRQAVNHWIRTSRAYDAVIDFDRAIRDPDNPARMRAAYDSGDNLHPNDAGYRAMADAIDLSLFNGQASGRRVVAAKPSSTQAAKPKAALCPCPP